MCSVGRARSGYPTLRAFHLSTFLSPTDRKPVPSMLDRVQGSLDMMILKTLMNGTMHGWGIAHHIRLRSRDALEVRQGALYPALHRLADAGLVRGEWGTSDNNRRARFYAITAAGRKHLAAEMADWKSFVEVVSLVMELA